MILTTVRIISFLPDDATRNERYKSHLLQLDYILNSPAVTNIVICQKGYKDEDKVQHSKIRYIDEPKESTGPGFARNVLLNDFYNSDEDFCLILDDDTILDSRFGLTLNDFFEEFGNLQIADIEPIGLLSPLSGGMVPYQTNFRTKTDLYENNFIISKTICYNFYIIRNFKKHFNKTLYFRHDSEFTTADRKFYPEDLEFNLCLEEELNLTRGNILNMIRKDLLGTKYSTWSQNQSERGPLRQEYKEKFKFKERSLAQRGKRKSKFVIPFYKKRDMIKIKES